MIKDPNDPKTYVRGFTRILLRAQSRGQKIVSDVPGMSGVEMRYAPRRKGDPAPWVPVDPKYRSHYLSGSQCRVYAPVSCVLRTDKGTGDHTVVATVSGDAVGHLTWRGDTGEVRYVWVSPRHRRRGVATAMWWNARMQSRASELRTGADSVIAPVHSSDLSVDGAAWVASLGRRS